MWREIVSPAIADQSSGHRKFDREGDTGCAAIEIIAEQSMNQTSVHGELHGGFRQQANSQRVRGKLAG
jgi:hypothetical protein